VDTESLVVLAWHVDYWDYLGWKDTFGSKAATERQKRYKAARGLPNLQTPHLFAANRPARGDEIAKVVAEEAKRKAAFAIGGRAQLEKGRVLFDGSVRALDGEGRGEGVTVQAVLFVRKAETKCAAGENKGSTLVEHYAVLEAGKPVPLADALGKGIKAGLRCRDFAEANLGIAVLVEDAARMETLACAAFPVHPS
jgi:hypothetical protein